NGGGNQITIVADRMALGAAPSSAITPTSGGDAILEPFTAGRLINLGSAVDSAANTLELSNTELGTITTGTDLVIGNAGSGAITVSAPVAVTNLGEMVLDTASGISNSVSTA